MVRETASLAEQDELTPSWMPILMYHRVVPEITGDDPYHLCITVREFEAQMRFLATEGYRPVSLEEVASSAPVEERASRRRVAITFDDGYLDLVQHALPVLEKYGFPATMFLVADYLGCSNTWDRGKTEQVPLLGPREIDRMRESSFSFGSHSRTHRPLGKLGPEDAWEEIAGSKQWLEDALGLRVETFCYPYGSATPEVREMVRRAGYVAACGIDRLHHSLFDLSRIDAAACRGTGLLWRTKMSGMHRKVRGSGVFRAFRDLARGRPGRV